MSLGFKQALILLGGLTVVVLLLVWFWSSFEKVQTEVNVGFQGDARRNPYLAAERLLRRLQLPVHSLDNLHHRPELPDSDSTLFLPVWRSTLGQQRHERMRAFVETGGHLILVGRLGRQPEAARRPDPLLGPLGVEVQVPEEDEEEDEATTGEEPSWRDEAAEEDSRGSCGDDDEESADDEADDEEWAEDLDEELDEPPWVTAETESPPAVEAESEVEREERVEAEAKAKARARAQRSRQRLDELLGDLFGAIDEGEPAPVRVPERDEPLQVTAERGEEAWELADRDGRAIWAVPGVTGYRILQYEVGRGLVTVLRGAAFMTNTHIGKDDNAELVWRLATWGGRKGPVWWVVGYEVPSLFTLMLRHGWMVLLAGIGWLVFWLARRVRRFGPAHPPPSPARRSLVEHIDATGHFLWRHGLSARLFANLREQVSRRAAARTPEWPRLDERQRQERLSELCGVPVAEVGAAMSPVTPNQRQPFTELVQRLERMMRKT